MSVRRCQQEIDSAEFVEWLAVYELEPFGEERADFRAGIIASTVANSVSKRHFSPRDFMPKWDRQVAAKPQQSLDQQRAIFEMFVSAQNASVGVTPNGTTKD